MRRIVIAMLVASLAGAFAQEEQKPGSAPPKFVTKLVPVKHVTGSQFNAMMKLLDNFGAGLRGDSQLKMLSVTGTPAIVQAVEEAVKRFDVPPPPARSAEIIMWVVTGSARPSDAKTPAELDPVIKQLRGIFPYASYRLLDVQYLRTREGTNINPPIMQGQLADPSGGTVPYTYDASFWVTSSEEASGRMFHLDNFSFVANRGGGPSRTQIAKLAMSVDVRDGQKAVVGKANMDQDTALFVVISVK
ncbi:MAG: hypothetical protein JNL98_22695 [Bryobacterales bacterium]|nr:hypothetical protein [Bryobacterales bacterium]